MRARDAERPDLYRAPRPVRNALKVQNGGSASASDGQPLAKIAPAPSRMFAYLCTTVRAANARICREERVTRSRSLQSVQWRTGPSWDGRCLLSTVGVVAVEVGEKTLESFEGTLGRTLAEPPIWRQSRSVGMTVRAAPERGVLCWLMTALERESTSGLGVLTCRGRRTWPGVTGMRSPLPGPAVRSPLRRTASRAPA
jgi:hypothetical protein